MEEGKRGGNTVGGKEKEEREKWEDRGWIDIIRYNLLHYYNGGGKGRKKDSRRERKRGRWERGKNGQEKGMGRVREEMGEKMGKHKEKVILRGRKEDTKRGVKV